MSEGQLFLADATQWQGRLRGLWRTARRQRWTRGPLCLTVTWVAPSAEARAALLAHAVDEGGVEVSEEDAAMDLGENDLAMRFQSPPQLAALDGLALRLQVLAAAHRATLRSLALGLGDPIA